MKRVWLFLLFIPAFLTIILNESSVLASKNNPQVPSGFREPIWGIYVTAGNSKGPQFEKLLSLVKNTELNAMVIDIKDDHGNLTFVPLKSSPYYSVSRPYITNPRGLVQTLETNNIYPIARVVVFKDNVFSNKNPNFSFGTPSGIWKNAHGDSFTNPFLKEVWDYNIGIALEAVKLGFKEIQFDYVRFPEKFETFEKQLIYNKGSYQKTDGRERVTAVTDFVKYASERLKPYNVKISVDVFGNATVIPEARGIGQNFSSIAENVDVISAMIYPSHWTAIFGIQKPDLHP
ncbi:MAG: putative glycoside hydrolase, partial [Neobacillus sp.]